MNVTLTSPLSLLREVQDQPEEGCLVVIYPATDPSGLTKLGSHELVIGRCPSSDVVLADDSVSRQHASIVRRDGAFVILDSKSTNGTMVNDVPVSEKALLAGDQIRIGNHILKFLSAHGIERQYHETVYSMMTTDALTKAWNKEYLVEALTRESVRASQHERLLSLMMLDLDHFKAINDSYGHLVGDEVLKAFGARCLGLLTMDQIFARFGGEEFAILISEQNPDGVAEIAEAIREAVARQPFVTSAGAVRVTVSIGIAHLSGLQELESTQLMRLADERLYQAKDSGRNCVVS